jgi:hypothetical protein
MYYDRLNYSGILDNTIHGQPDMFFPGGALRQLLGPNNGAPVVGGYGGYGGYGGAGGGGMPSWQELQRKLDEANAANQNRYMQLLTGSDAAKAEELGGLRTGYNEMLGLAGKGADAQRMQEQQNLKHAEGAAQADATSRGLGNTTILSSLRRGAENESAIRTQGINDAQDRNKLSVAQNYYHNLLAATQGANNRKMGFIENRTDQGPDLGMYYQLLSQPGAMGGGFNGGSYPMVRGGGYGGGGAPQIGGSLQRTPGNGATVGGWGGYNANPGIPRPKIVERRAMQGNVGGMPFTYQV